MAAHARAPGIDGLDRPVLLLPGELRLALGNHALHLAARVLQALLQISEGRHDEARGAAQALGLGRHGAARHVDLRPTEVEPDVLQAREDVRVARRAQARDVEQHRQALVVDAAVEVLEVDDVADGLGRAVVLLHLLGSVHGVSLIPPPSEGELSAIPGERPRRLAPAPVRVRSSPCHGAIGRWVLDRRHRPHRRSKNMNAAHLGATFALLLAVAPASAQNVKITPIGSHPGELCASDRAMVFEDPTGVRFLYDPAHNMTGGDDPRLGTIHLVLLSHMHGDHVGDLKLKAPGAGTCANPERVPAPNSTTAEVAAAKNAALVMTRAMSGFVAAKIQAMGVGKPIGFCPQKDGATSVPVETVCASQTDLGGVFVAKAANASQGVEISIVYASHVNNAPPA